MEKNVIQENLIFDNLNWLNTKEAADYLRLSEQALRTMTSNGKVPFYKLGSRNRYCRDDLDQILLSNKRGGFYGI